MGFISDSLKKQKGFVEVISQKEGIGKLNLWLSWLKCYMRYGATPSDWYNYELYKYRHGTARKFITRRKNLELDLLFNPRRFSEDFNNKHRFNEVYRNFVHRKWFLHPQTQLSDIQKHKWGG